MTEIKLQYPIHKDGHEIDHLRIRRPKVNDRLLIEQLEGNQAEKEVKLLASLCHIDEKLIRELDLSDYIKLQETFIKFLAGHQEKQ